MLDNLNQMQIEAVKHKDGPLLILAGAGSGKTKVLTTRIAYLIKEYGISPDEILAITFTNKAANEMKERINKLIPNTNLLACTFHSFGVRILRSNYDRLGYNKNFVILDSDDSLTLVKKIMKDYNIDPKRISPYIIRNKISNNKSEFIMPDEYKKFVCSEEDDVVYKVYKKYQDTLFKNNSVDFDDLLILPIKLFNENKDVLEYYQEKYKYILIDEYQDTNRAQYILSKMISAKYKNICAIGDNDQSIYSFRNADYRNILNFEKDYPLCKTIMLEQNYRSTKNILNAANCIIKNNEKRKDKKLWSNNEIGDKITVYKANDELDETFYCIRKIKDLVKDGISYSDIVILYRTNAQSRVFESELLKANIPFRIVGSFYFYSRKEIKDLLAYLRLIHNHNDDISLLRIINTPKRGIGLKSIANLEERASLNNCSLFEAITSSKELEFKNMILELSKEKDNLSLTDFVELVLEKSGLRASLKEENSLEADIRLENLEEFKSVTKTFEEQSGIISLEDFLLEVSLVSDIEEYRDDPNRITLMTVHSVKGLEFLYVFLVGMEEGLFPHKNSFSKEEQEEERRLMYVAVTRAKKKLYITWAKQRRIYGIDQIGIKSRFINEIDNDLLELDNKEELKAIKKENKMYDSDQEYTYGDKIEHDTYGVGVVIEVSKTIIDDVLKGYSVPNDRIKPLGTAHAIYSARNLIDTDFAVINADDFYGYDAFRVLSEALDNTSCNEYAMVAYKVCNTITLNGSVKRGVCQVEDGYLKGIDESVIELVDDKIRKTSMINGDVSIIDRNTLVSMNLFGFKKNFINYVVRDFKDFLDNSDLSCDEFFLPSVVFNCIKRGDCKVKVYSTSEKTYGVTYKEDKEDVVKGIENKIKDGVYPEKLWN